MDAANVFWLALALVLVIEGLFPFVSPAYWKRLFLQMVKLEDGQIRFFGMCSILVGLVLIWLLT